MATMKIAQNLIDAPLKQKSQNSILSHIHGLKQINIDSKQNVLIFTYANSTNIYKFSLSYDLNGDLILHVENKGLSQVIKDPNNLLKLIKLIIK